MCVVRALPLLFPLLREENTLVACGATKLGAVKQGATSELPLIHLGPGYVESGPKRDFWRKSKKLYVDSESLEQCIQSKLPWNWLSFAPFPR